MAKRVISVPVLAALGVAPDGQKRLLSLRLAVSEASTHWGSMLEGLQAQGLRAPKLVISDGHKGLTKALEKWCFRHQVLVMCTHPIAKEAFALHLACSEGRKRYFGCNLVHRKVLASSHQHLMAEAPKTPLHILIDSSGLAVHAGQLRRAPKSRDYRKLHLCVDEQSGEVVAGELTSKRSPAERIGETGSNGGHRRPRRAWLHTTLSC